MSIFGYHGLGGGGGKKRLGKFTGEIEKLGGFFLGKVLKEKKKKEYYAPLS